MSLESVDGAVAPKRGPITQPTVANTFVGAIDTTDPSLAALRKKNPAQPEPMHDATILGIAAIAGLTAPGLLAQPFWFQCPPIDVLPQDFSWQWNDFQTIDTGMHSNPSSPQLATYTISTLFVDDDVDYWYTLFTDDDVLAMNLALKKIADSMTPVLLVWGQPQLWGRWEVAMAVTIRSFHVEERSGESDARYLTLTFTEYPDAPVKPPAPPSVAGVGHKTAPHTTRQGTKVLAVLNSAALPEKYSTLAKIAKVYYGAASGWSLIAKASGLKNVTANQDLRSTVGKKKPPPKITIPARKK